MFLQRFLISGINRANDVNLPPASAEELELLDYPPFLEDNLIARLLQLNANYNAHSPVRYACFPDEGGLEYNSNSYTAGLLKAAGIRLPWFPLIRVNPTTGFVEYPGWTKPVPKDQFQGR